MNHPRNFRPKKGEGFYSANTVLLITKVCHFKKNYVCPPPPPPPPQSVIASYGPVYHYRAIVSWNYGYISFKSSYLHGCFPV